VLSLIEKTQYLVFLLKLPTSSNMLLRLTIIVDDWGIWFRNYAIWSSSVVYIYSTRTLFPVYMYSICGCFIPKNKAKTSHWHWYFYDFQKHATFDL